MKKILILGMITAIFISGCGKKPDEATQMQISLDRYERFATNGISISV